MRHLSALQLAPARLEESSSTENEFVREESPVHPFETTIDIILLNQWNIVAVLLFVVFARFTAQIRM